MQPSIRAVHRLALAAGLLAGSLLAAGCATAAPSAPAVPAASPTAVAPEPGFVPVARYGRYTLVELVPEPAQRDLLQQVVEVSIPPMLDATWAMPCATCCCAPATGSAMRRGRGAVRAAAACRAPAPGPLMLRDALLTLAGPPGSCRSMT
jgi:type IV pili sensor histidine kinase/response regulator